MFFLRKPSKSVVEKFLSRQPGMVFSYSEVGSTNGVVPRNFTLDQNSVNLGRGGQIFQQGSTALRAWQMFRLGWVEVSPASPRIEAGEHVAVLVKHFGFWSLNACRIVYVIDEVHRFGFAYGTLDDHAKKGEERFSVEWREDGSVHYTIVAFSQPGKWQVRLFRPLGRVLQKKFARDSTAAMLHAVQSMNV